MARGVNRDRPFTWVPYRLSNCASCKATCCTFPVEVSLPDLFRLGVTTEDEASFDLPTLVKRLKKAGIIQKFTPKTGIFVLTQKNGDDCFYLDSKTRLCTVYEQRPKVCRGFPETVGSRTGYCPYIPKSK
ncbi:MAG: YkgJ family cysteine cluster protein [Bdellovibrionales bacterium]|nr:YkgJ family cysteine cluster protein [Bdellovibrionales bacterium]